ncbi:MAG: adenylosuccinate synthase [Candidatus Korarchaeum sp.]|nr:adenylosuccinate synthase [Candidatus Korarchaeum sp.]MDW8035387.1 adenylosuccinate synthase [Candidatus Korarchaeum sp.]
MPAIVVVGMQFGDESKGAVVDFLAEWADLVVRYNGGSNAGHTVVAEGLKYKFHLVPSGAARGKRCVIGAGVAFDPEVFMEEVEELRRRGKRLDILISLKATLLLPYHKELDASLTGGSLGTTKRGIGPAYQDKMARITGLRMKDLLAEDFPERLRRVLELKEADLKRANFLKGDLRDYYEELLRKAEIWKEFLRPFTGEDHLEVNNAIASGKLVIFEGAQGTMLDVDHGTYPFVTSSSTVAGGACTGVGVSPLVIDAVLGVCKAYTSRVGAGPFPTELLGSQADYIRERGGEYGTTTGRPRRVGWLDIPMLRYSALVNGVGYLAVRKLDVLSGMRRIKVAVAYEVDGEEYRVAPPYADEMSKAKPIYVELEGWEEQDWRSIVKRGWESLPEEMKAYVGFLERELNVRTVMVGLGPEREMTIVTPAFQELLGSLIGVHTRG